MSTAKPSWAPCSARKSGEPRAVLAEMEIEADGRAADAEAADQDALDEVLGRGAGERGVEGHDDGAVEPGGGEQAQLVALARELEQRLLRPEEAARMRLEGQRRRLAAERRGRARSAASITARWPRCTPSKLPIATTAPRKRAGVACARAVRPRATWKGLVSDARHWTVTCSFDAAAVAKRRPAYGYAARLTERVQINRLIQAGAG